MQTAEGRAHLEGMIDPVDGGYQINYPDGTSRLVDEMSLRDSRLADSVDGTRSGNEGEAVLELGSVLYALHNNAIAPPHHLLTGNESAMIPFDAHFLHNITPEQSGLYRHLLTEVADGNAVATFGTHPHPDGDRAQFEVSDAFGNPQKLYYSHAYAGMYNEAAGLVELENPHDTTSRISLRPEQAAEYFYNMEVSPLPGNEFSIPAHLSENFEASLAVSSHFNERVEQSGPFIFPGVAKEDLGGDFIGKGLEERYAETAKASYTPLDKDPQRANHQSAPNPAQEASPEAAPNPFGLPPGALESVKDCGRAISSGGEEEAIDGGIPGEQPAPSVAASGGKSPQAPYAGMQ